MKLFDRRFRPAWIMVGVVISILLAPRGFRAWERIGTPATVDLPSIPVLWEGRGGQEGANYGISAGPGGDVNGDGFADFLVGADEHDADHPDAGRAYLYLGSASGLDTTASWTADGSEAGATFGHRVVSAGDVNGDGFDDILVSAYREDAPGVNQGRGYLYLGGSSGPGTVADWTAAGEVSGARFSQSINRAGDVNGDGFGDVIVGAPLHRTASSEVGKAYVYYGSASGLDTQPGWTAESNQTASFFGFPVISVGDINGDDYDDIAVSAIYYDAGQNNEGKTFVYHGSASGPSNVADWTFESDRVGASSGFAMNGGDLNGDGFADLVLGAQTGGPGQEGAARVFLGSPAGLSLLPIREYLGPAPTSYFGFPVVTVDRIADGGYADLIVGSIYIPGDQGPDQGQLRIYPASITGPADPETLVVLGDQPGAGWPFNASAAGDFNQDGLLDISIGARAWDGDHTDEGRVVIYDRVAFTGSGVGGVPSRSDGADAPLLVDRTGSQVQLSWSAPCTGPAEDFAIYTGPLAWPPAAVVLTCTTGGARFYDLPTDSESAYYLIAPIVNGTEGSSGTNLGVGAGSPEERPRAVPACFPRAIAECPALP